MDETGSTTLYTEDQKMMAAMTHYAIMRSLEL